MRIRYAAVPVLSCVLAVPAALVGSTQTLKPEMLAQFDQKTGLKPVDIPGTQGFYMGKTHRGYTVVFTAKSGNVWGPYAARLTMAEIGKEAGGFAAYLTGQQGRISESVVGSPLDRLLSAYLGQPVTIVFVLTHKKPNARRLDIVTDRSVIGPDDKLPRREKIGGNAGSIYAADGDFAARVQGNATLMKRLKSLRNEYLRSDHEAVSFFFAGTEVEYSGLIRDHGDYFRMLNDLMDDLADIADAIQPKS